jgi:hypothetical protein
VIINLLKLIGEILKPLWNLVLTPLFDFIGKTVIVSLEILANKLNNLASLLGKATEAVKVFKTWASGLSINLKDNFSSVWSRVSSTWNNLRNKSATLTLGLSDYFSSKWRSIKGLWDGIKSKTVTIGISFKNALTSAWNSLVRTIDKARAKSKIAKSILPNLPFLAEGGFVDRNTPQLAVIGDNRHEGEIVSPESKLQEMANKASQGSNQEVVRLLTQLLNAVQGIDPNVYLDGESIKNNTVRRINNHTRATGQLEIIV